MILKKYICSIPFTRAEIYDEDIYPCHIDFINTSIVSTTNVKNIYNSEMLYKVRKSILDGEYEYCNKDKCTFLIDLLYNNTISEKFILKDNIDENLINNKITDVRLNLDQSCNLYCSSCRKSVISLKENEQKKLKDRLNDIINSLGDDIENLSITGIGDPFSSKIYIDFLINFDESKFPNLKNISLFTNATLLDEKMWSRIEKSHKYINKMQISIDAATKETYEKIRRGGKWETLLKNINFLLTIPTIQTINFMFVVQDTNYKEMKMFVDFVNELSHVNNNKNIVFVKIYNWGTYTTEEYKQKKIWDESHPEFNDFLKELKSITNYKVHNANIYINQFIKSIKNEKRII